MKSPLSEWPIDKVRHETPKGITYTAIMQKNIEVRLPSNLSYATNSLKNGIIIPLK